MTKPNLFTLLLVFVLLAAAILLYTLTEQHEIAALLAGGALTLAVPNRIGPAAAKLVVVFALAALTMTSSACSPSTAAATCGAYETVVEPARAMCHRACDAIPSECPWAGTAGGDNELEQQLAVE